MIKVNLIGEYGMSTQNFEYEAQAILSVWFHVESFGIERCELEIVQSSNGEILYTKGYANAVKCIGPNRESFGCSCAQGTEINIYIE